jgi:tetratricopeptide (TPR) repeat protein
MSAISPAEPRPRPQPSLKRDGQAKNSRDRPNLGLQAIDVTLVSLFLALTFLLGIFPLKDADYFWHLRTGDLIRKTGEIPRVDFYTFTRQGTPWIDLHWIFQVGISWLNEHGGVPALTLAKSAITCLAVLLLITARRRSWPIWAMVLAWLPALLVLSGRMYVRPETLSLLYLAVYLAVIFRWDRFPLLAWLLPFVQAAWVNSQGLFVLGPVLLGFGLVDAALRRGAFAAERRRWWQIVVPACAVTGLACLLNPYGVHGAIYPLELAGTMSNPIFSRSIAELTPIPAFVNKAGFTNLPLQLHLLTMALGALSFVVPGCWLAWTRLRRGRAGDEPEPTSTRKPSRGERKGRTRKGQPAPVVAEREGGWRISVFRLLLYVAFSALSLQATRNSHQFAAVVGTVTAWNFAEWAAARRTHATPSEPTISGSGGIGPRVIALIALVLVSFLIGSGQFYRLTGEGRTIAWGEEPLFFAHDATMFTGESGMPDRFLSYHNAHAALFEYYHSPERPNGPGRTVYTDPRLEVAGAELFDRYQKLGERIVADKPGWEAELDGIGRPSIMVDHQDNAQIGASLLGSRRWKCVWFDSTVAVFVHDQYASVVAGHTVDFAARHFRPDPATEPHGFAELLASAKGVRNYLDFSMTRGGLQPPLMWLAQDYARRLIDTAPDSAEGWKIIAQVESLRSVPQPAPRFRLPFDPIFDLPLVRATYAYRRALELAPHDFLSILGLEKVYEARLMNEAALPLLDRLVSLHPINQLQRNQQSLAESERVQMRQALGPAISTAWKNLAELDQLVNDELSKGQAGKAAETLERAYPTAKAPWEIVDRIAALRLHLGEPEKARALWQAASSVPRPALREARKGAAFLAEGRFDEARHAFEQALSTDPALFEARYGLAVLEQDDGHASAAYEHALAAIESAPSDVARSAARAIASGVSRFARKETSRSISSNAPTDKR